MSKDWRTYAEHILETIQKLERIQQRGDLGDIDAQTILTVLQDDLPPLQQAVRKMLNASNR